MLSHSEAGRFTSQFINTFMNKKVTFPERVERLQTAAESLRVVLEIVEAEATAIADAHKRFSARKTQSRSVKSAE
jgi:hypothetical protein